jgi:hypothetical protein
MHQQHVSQVSSLHSLRTPDDIISTIQPYERDQSKLYLAFKTYGPKNGHCMGTPQTASRSEEHGSGQQDISGSTGL